MHFLVFLFIILDIQVVLPCLYWVFPDALGPDENDCCKSKKLGDDTYNYIETSTDTSSFNCESECVYSKVTEPGSRYCFKSGGDQHPECSSSVTIGWHDRMEPVFKCVYPGTKINFQWLSDGETNVNIIEKENYHSCNVNNATNEKSPSSFIPSTLGFHYFVSGDHNQCLNGMKAAIVVDHNCNCTKEHLYTGDGLFPITEDLKRLWEDSKKDNHTSLNYSETMHQLYSLALKVLSPYQRNVMIESPPCSAARQECDICFGLLLDLAMGCTVDMNQGEEACLPRIPVAKAVCKDCLCELRKVCNNSIICKEALPKEAVHRPENPKHPCERDCTNTTARTCVFNFKLESLYSDASGRMADGRNRSVLAYNKEIPGPRIVICEGDTLEVNLENGLEENTTLHFHGIREINTPWSDGVPFVTQCPIKKDNSFSYGFTAKDFDGASPGTYTQSGTYWFHSHVGSQRTNGAYGAFIIRPNKKEDRFDVDDTENTIILQEWYDGPEINQTVKSILINGQGRFNSTSQTKYMEYNVEPNKSILFRVIGAISQDFPMHLSIEDHNFTAIAADSQNIEPVEDLTGLWIAGGERFDIVVKTHEDIQDKPYKIKVFGYSDPNEQTKNFCTIAWLIYTGQVISAAETSYFADCNSSDFEPPTSFYRTLNPIPNNYGEWNETRIQYPDWKNTSRPGYIFVNALRSLRIKPGLSFYPKNPQARMVTNTQYISLKHASFNMKRIKTPPTVPFLLQNRTNENLNRCGMSCNITVKPTLNVTLALNEKYISSACVKINDTCQKYGDEDICPCEHVIEQPYAPGYWFELILINDHVNDAAHPIHQHGGWFWVIGMDKYDHDINRTFIETMDGKNKTGLPRNFTFPPAKDTIQVPPGGYVILRSPSDNKGTWFFHCHINRHVLDGMALVLQVGGFGKNITLGQDWCTGPLEKDMNKEC